MSESIEDRLAREVTLRSNYELLISDLNAQVASLKQRPLEPDLMEELVRLRDWKSRTTEYLQVIEDANAKIAEVLKIA